ncbi:hypothetical protein ACIRBZ_04435 [Streptomyces sp. NPDC094038]|uniref:hypothetical protein n=1 Tax=Streptomyces sp. NPDC094038 TaxID=3366055 RepID=UPI003812B0AF
MHDEGESDRVRENLLSWARDAGAPLTERIAAAATAGSRPHEQWYPLAADPAGPPQLRVTICKRLPASGACNRVPLLRGLATDPAHPVDVRASAAALLAEDLGEEGRLALHALSGPDTTDPEAHLAVGAAWGRLDVGSEAEVAYRRVLEDAQALPRHRVRAAGELTRWRSARERARQALCSVLSGQGAPVAVRIEAAEKLIAAHATADAHLGLFRLAVGPEPTREERSRIVALLPADLGAHAGRNGPSGA